MTWNATEAEYGEAPIRVVWLDDLAYVIKGRFVLIVSTHVVQRTWVAWFTV